MHVQRYLRVFTNKPLYYRRQRVARLSMGCGDRQATAVRAVVLLGQLLNTLDLTQYFPGYFKYLLAGWCYSGKMFAAARKYFNSQFILEKTNLFTNTGLRGV